MKTVTRCPKNRDENGSFAVNFVTVSVTSLIYHTYQAKLERRPEGGEHAR